jgi:hypothetical protein
VLLQYGHHTGVGVNMPGLQPGVGFQALDDSHQSSYISQCGYSNQGWTSMGISFGGNDFVGSAGGKFKEVS